MSSSWLRCLTLLSATALAIASLTGCGSSSAGLAQREIIVLFEGDTPQSVRAHVRQACADLPGTSPRPRPDTGSGSVHPYAMRFRIDQATVEQRSQLYECLGQFDSVKGVKQPGM